MPTSQWTTARKNHERRRMHRSPASWPVRLWLGENLFTPARVVDISRGGIRIRLSPAVSKTLLRLGQGYQLELSPGFAENFLCIAEVRHLHEHGVGLSIKEILAQGPARSAPAVRAVMHPPHAAWR
jgi:hypothetical protein